MYELLSIFNQTLPSHLPYSLNQYAWIIFPILFLVDGLIFGVAVRKGSTALILTIIGFLLADFIGVSFLPNFSVSSLYHSIYTFATSQTLGTISISTSVVLFVVGVIVGYILGR